MNIELKETNGKEVEMKKKRKSKCKEYRRKEYLETKETVSTIMNDH